MREMAVPLHKFILLLSISRSLAGMRGVTVLLMLVGFCGCAQPLMTPHDSQVDGRISYYARKVADHPRLYPVYAQLGAAYLDKARDTSDPVWLAKARAALNRSMDIQPSFEAFKTMTAVSNFAHRFEDALKWGKRAAEAYPADTEVTALLVEAHMGLGLYEEARKLLPHPGKTADDFYMAAALGNWLVSQRRHDEAAAAFQIASNLAQAAGVRELVVWAEVSTAGVFIDSHRLESARLHLEKGTALDARNARLRLHQAELLGAEGNPMDAFAVYEVLSKERNDPEIHRKAFVLARQLGKKSKAQLHFDAAEEGFQRAIDAGEIYTLGALAQLYCDAEIKLQQALALAERNLQYKRDLDAEETVACIRRKQPKP